MRERPPGTWQRFRIARGHGVADAEALDGGGGPDAAASPLDGLLSSDGARGLELVLGGLRSHEAEFLRVDSRAGDGLEVAVLAADAETFVLVRRSRPHSGGLGRLAYVYSVLSRSRDAVVYTDSAAAILGASSPWLDLYGLRPEDVLGRNPRIVNARRVPSSFFRGVWRELTDPAVGSWSGELVNRRVSGELLHVWQTITTFRDAEEAVAGYLGVTRDITQHRETLARLEATNRELERQNCLKDDLLDGIRRQLAEPLAELSYQLERATAEGASPSPGAATLLAAARDSAHGLKDCLKQWLALGRAGLGEAAPAVERVYFRSIARAEAALAAEAARERGVHICVGEVGPSPPSLGDKRRISRAVARVFSAALAAAAPDSEVAVVLRAGADGAHEMSVELPGDGGSAGRGESAARRVSTEPPAARGTPVAAAGRALQEAGAIAELLGGTLRREQGPAGRSRIILRLPVDWSAFGDRLWAAAVFDPGERLWPALSKLFRVGGIPAFVAQRQADFQQVCQRELPNLLVAPADEELPAGVERLRAPGTGGELEPAVCRLRCEDGTGRLDLASVDAAPVLARDLWRVLVAASLKVGRLDASIPGQARAQRQRYG